MDDDSENQQLSDGEITDVLPEDLDLDALDHAEYVFPNNNRRRVPGILYLACAVAVIVCWFVVRDDSSTFLNTGLLWGAIGLAALGLIHLVAGWNLDADERDALVAATREVGFPIGHASAQMGWRGWLSRPTWRILLYSNEPQPTKRGLVLVDGVDGSIVERFVEDNPEDWSEYNTPTKPSSDAALADTEDSATED